MENHDLFELKIPIILRAVSSRRRIRFPCREVHVVLSQNEVL